MMNGASVESSLRGRVAGARAPGPRFLTPFGFLAVMRRDPLGFLMQCRREYGDVVEVRFGPWTTLLCFHPDEVRHILHENHRNYWKGLLFAKLKRIAGDGLVFSDGPLWRRQRQLIQPAFHRERIAAMAQMMVSSTAEMLDRWQRTAADGRPRDVAAEASGLTLDIVAKALFGTDLGEDSDAFTAAVTSGLAYANYVVNHFFTPPLIIPTPTNVRARRAIANLDRIVWKVIEQRRRESQPRNDLLGMLISARDAETNEAMDDKQLRDEAVTFLTAGHETTAVALAWAWHLLATHPDAEERLQAEVEHALGGRPATVADLPNLPYTRMVLEEAMRLYPPAWATVRESYAEDELGGFRMPARTTVTVSPYVTHRHPEFWDDPDRFIPERFAPERNDGRPEYAYFPFGGGPRGCVGRQFAVMEGQLILASVAQRFRLRPVAGAVVEPDPILTLRPRHGLLMHVTPRSSGL